MPILVCLQKNSSDFRTIRETKRNFLSRTDVFLESPKSTLNLARFDTKVVAVRKILLPALWQGSLGKFGLIVLFVSCAFIVRVAEAPPDHESTNEEDFRGCSRGDCSLKKSTSRAQVFKTVEISIDSFEDLKNLSFK